jgi:hypothetical protein
MSMRLFIPNFVGVKGFGGSYRLASIARFADQGWKNVRVVVRG